MSDAIQRKHLFWRSLGALSWCLDKAVTSLNALGTLIIMALMVLICSDVVSRNAFGHSLPGVIELAELSIVSIVFLQIADTLKSGKLMRSDALIRKLSQTNPRIGLVLNILFDTAGALLFYFITHGAIVRFLKAWSGGFYLGNLGSFTVKTWPMELCVALGSSLMCLLFATQALKACAALMRGTPPPVQKVPDVGREYDA